MLTELLLFLLFLLIVYLCIPFKPNGLPPGLWGWPVVGSLPKAGISFADQVKEIREKYRDIVSWRIGGTIMIFLCNAKLIKEVFSKVEATDRPDYYSLRLIRRFTHTGVMNSSGTQWHHNRRFILRHLRDLGFGKSVLEGAVQHEVKGLIKNLEKQTGYPEYFPWSIHVAIINVFWQLVAGRRFDLNDSKISQLHQGSMDLIKAFEGPVQWLDFFPWLVPLIPDFMKEKLGMKSVYHISKEVGSNFTDVIDDHIADLDPENPKDLIDDYLIAMNNQEENGSENLMSIMDLEMVLMDLFVAGSDTTTFTIRWSLMYMAKYPEIQKKVQKEIDSVVPRDRLPTLEDKERLPYTEALTYELLRITSLSIMGVPHCASKDISIDGYTIPKGSVICSHIRLCNFDPKCWENPEELRPENFLDDQGKVLKAKEGFAPFALGRRSCVGESLAKMEFFLFLSSLLQAFTYSPPPGETVCVDTDVNERFVNFPQNVKLVINKRK